MKKKQSEKAAYCMVPTLWHSGKGKTMETVERSVVGRGQRGGGMDRQRIFRAVEVSV